MIFIRPHTTHSYGLYHPCSSFMNPRIYRLTNGNETKPSAENEKEDGKRKLHDSSVIYQSREAQVTENDNTFNLTMDLPGVKKDNISIEVEGDVLRVYAERKSGDTLTAKYRQHFVVDEKTAELDQLQANLSDGVLAVSIPKKEASKPIEVAVTNAYPPEETEDKKDMRFSLDVPGVKLADLKIRFHDDKLHIEGERKKGESVFQVRRTLSIDEKKIDQSGLRAFLADGVLTVTAPRKEVPPPRKFSITVNTPTGPEQASNKEAEISVETVDEEEEKKESEEEPKA